MAYIGRRFSLSEVPDIGVSCSEKGVFVGVVPLLERVWNSDDIGQDQWRLRPASDLNRDLSACYGLPVEVDQKIDGLVGVGQALSRGDIMHAQIATLHSEFPNPPPLAKSTQTLDDVLDLARQLRSSGMLKADWDPTLHPRWPAGSPGGIGGEFAPADGVSEDSATEAPNVVPAQLTIPAPFELPGSIPLPLEIVPPPVIPNAYPRSNLRNPYPDRPECEEEWAHALEYCNELLRSGRMATDGVRGFGRTFQQCVLGMVREDCGGSLRS